MAFTDPEKNVAELHLRDGMIVADLGAGMGAHAIVAGKKVGDHGRVYAVEVQKDFLQNIKTAARDAKLSNIEVIWGDIEVPHGTKIADGSVDAVIIANVLFQAEDKKGLVAEAMRILKSGGQVMLLDWTDSFGGLGPHPREVVTEQIAKRILGEGGFAFSRSFPAGDHHYGLIAAKP